MNSNNHLEYVQTILLHIYRVLTTRSVFDPPRLTEIQEQLLLCTQEILEYLKRVERKKSLGPISPEQLDSIRNHLTAIIGNAQLLRKNKPSVRGVRDVSFEIEQTAWTVVKQLDSSAP